MRKRLQGARYSDWALIATASPRHFLLIRCSVSRPDHVTFYICWAPQEVPATMTRFVCIAGRRWPSEETFKAGKDVHGWGQCQARGFGAICRHSALTALAQLRHAAIRNALCGDITVTASSQQEEEEEEKKKKTELEQESAADLGIPLGDAPVPSRPGQPCPSGIAAVPALRRCAITRPGTALTCASTPPVHAPTSSMLAHAAVSLSLASTKQAASRPPQMTPVYSRPHPSVPSLTVPNTRRRHLRAAAEHALNVKHGL